MYRPRLLLLLSQNKHSIIAIVFVIIVMIFFFFSPLFYYHLIVILPRRVVLFAFPMKWFSSFSVEIKYNLNIGFFSLYNTEKFTIHFF